MKNSLHARAAALVLALVLAIACVPAAVAETNDISGTRWYFSGVSCALTDLMDPGSQLLLKGLASLFLPFVPTVADLQKQSMGGICIRLAFNSDGTCIMITLHSINGVIDSDSFSLWTGTWTQLGSWVGLESEGSLTPMTLEDGVLTVSAFGFSAVFLQD